MSIELAVRAAVILAAAWLLVRVLPRATAATRHLVWHGAVVAVLLAPVLSPVVPKYRLALLDAVRQVQPPFAFGAMAGKGPSADLSRVTPEGAQAGAPQARRRIPPVHQVHALGAFGTLGTIAALGTTVTGVWFASAWLLTMVKIRRAAPAPLAWQLEANSVREKLRIAREVQVRVMAEASTPFAAGILRPTILLPQLASAWTTERRRAVLLHELAHVRRRDCLVQLLAHVACALYWYNPLIWVAAAQLRLEREHACDDEVLRSGAQASAYAAHLLDVARELRPSLAPTVAVAMARRAGIEARLLSVLAVHSVKPLAVTRWAITLVIAATTGAALGASTTPKIVRATATTRVSASPQDVMSTADRAEAMRMRIAAEERLQASLDPQERERAVMDLVATSEGEAIAPLQRALDDPSQDVREKAAMALSFMSGNEVVPALLRALEDPDAQVREKAAIGLALRRDGRVIQPLIAAMRDPDAQVREKAAIALGTSGDSRARAPLTFALNDSDRQVREKAAAALVLLTTSR